MPINQGTGQRRRYQEPVHPATGEPLTALQRHLWRFRMVAHEVHLMIRGFNSQPDVAALGDDLLFSIMNHALILVCKFLEIWDEFGSLARDAPRVIEVRRAVQPAIDRIRVWRGLEQFRNTALAHPYLTKDGKLIGPWQLTGDELAPTYHAEVLVLLNCVNLGIVAVLSAFEVEYRGIKPLFGTQAPNPSKGPGVEKATEFGPVLKPLAIEVNQNMKELGVSMTAIDKEFQAMIRPPKGPPLIPGAAGL